MCCMQPRTPKLLDDIRDAAAYIAEVTHDLGEDAYRTNRMLRQSIERNFEIIGEAMGRLARYDPATASRISNQKQIIDFRNLLIHGYDQIDPGVVWGIIQRDVPLLLREMRTLIDEYNGPER